MWSTVWPGVCTTNHSRPPSRRRSPWCTRSVGSGGVNSIRIARIISLRFSGGPWFVVPHGVVAPHGLDGRFGLVGVVVHDVGIVDRRQLVGRDVDRLRVRRGFDLDPARLAFGERAVRPRALHRPGRERVVRDELGARLARDAPGAAEVIGVRVGDDDGVHVLQPVAGGLKPLLQRLPRLRTGQARDRRR